MKQFLPYFPKMLTYHVRRGEITHNEFVLLRLDDLGHFLRNSFDAHTGIQVVRGHLWTGD